MVLDANIIRIMTKSIGHKAVVDNYIWSIRDILNRVKEILQCRTDRELAGMLGIPTSTLSTWVKRDSMDWPGVLHLVVVHNGDINYVLLGEKSGSDTQELIQLRAKVADYEALIIAAMKGNTAGFGSSTIFKRNEASLTDQ